MTEAAELPCDFCLRDGQTCVRCTAAAAKRLREPLIQEEYELDVADPFTRMFSLLERCAQRYRDAKAECERLRGERGGTVVPEAIAQQELIRANQVIEQLTAQWARAVSWKSVDGRYIETKGVGPVAPSLRSFTTLHEAATRYVNNPSPTTEKWLRAVLAQVEPGMFKTRAS